MWQRTRASRARLPRSRAGSCPVATPPTAASSSAAKAVKSSPPPASSGRCGRPVGRQERQWTGSGLEDERGPFEVDLEAVDEGPAAMLRAPLEQDSAGPPGP